MKILVLKSSLFFAQVAFLSCCATSTSNKGSAPAVSVATGEYSDFDRAIGSMATMFRNELSSNQADAYVELWLIATDASNAIIGYAIARSNGRYRGIASHGEANRQPKAIAVLEPTTSWHEILSPILNDPLLEIDDDIRYERRPPIPLHGTALYLRVQRNDKLHKVLFYDPWRLRDEREALITGAASNLMNSVRLKKDGELRRKWKIR